MCLPSTIHDVWNLKSEGCLKYQVALNIATMAGQY